MPKLWTIDKTCNSIIDAAILGETFTKQDVVNKLMSFSSLAAWKAAQVADVVMIELAKI